MANRVGGIAITLTANAKSFIMGVNTARTSLTGLSNATINAQTNVRSLGMVGTTVATGLGSAFGSFIGGLAVRAVYSFIHAVQSAIATTKHWFNQQREVLDRIGKFSRELGFSVLSLQKFRLGASLAGTAVIDMEKGLQIMTRRIGEAVAGTGEARKAFAALGLEARALAELGPEKAFLEIQQRIAGMTQRTDQAAIAFMIFSRQGVNLLNFLKEGTTSFAELQKIVQATGGDLSGDAVKGVEMMNDSIEKATVTLQFFIQGVIARMAPAITYALDTLIGMATQFGKNESAANRFVDLATEKLIQFAEWVVVVAKEATDFGVSFALYLADVALNLSAVAQGASYVASAFGFVSNVLESIMAFPTVLIRGFKVFFDFVSNSAQGLVNIWNLATGKISFDEFAKRQKQSVDNIADSALNSFNKIKEGYSAIWNSDNTTGDKLRELSTDLEGLEKPIRRGAAGIARFGQHIEAMKGKPTKAIENFNKAAQAHMSDLVNKMSDVDPFEPIRESAEETKKFVTDVFKSGELALMATASLATDVSFLKNNDKESLGGASSEAASDYTDESLNVNSSSVFDTMPEDPIPIEKQRALTKADSTDDLISITNETLMKILQSLQTGIPATVA